MSPTDTVKRGSLRSDASKSSAMIEDPLRASDAHGDFDLERIPCRRRETDSLERESFV